MDRDRAVRTGPSHGHWRQVPTVDHVEALRRSTRTAIRPQTGIGPEERRARQRRAERAARAFEAFVGLPPNSVHVDDVPVIGIAARCAVPQLDGPWKTLIPPL